MDMNIQSYIENLKTKPEPTKKRFAFWTSFGITFVIFVFWLASFSFSANPNKSVVTATVEKAGSPGSSLIAGVGSFFVDIKDMIFGSRKVTYSTVEVKPGN